MLQRIYGTSFPKKAALDEYLNRLEEAKKRDHRKLGQELKLFTVMDEGPGFPFFFPKGMVLRNELENYWHQIHREWGYQEIKSPIILNRQLWERSGHWYHYRDNMYTTVIDEEDFAIKPMNCPGSMLVYNSECTVIGICLLVWQKLGLDNRQNYRHPSWRCGCSFTR